MHSGQVQGVASRLSGRETVSAQSSNEIVDVSQEKVDWCHTITLRSSCILSEGCHFSKKILRS